MAKRRAALVPHYLTQFSCIGSSCEDSCCSGWGVTIDELTYKKYQRVRDVSLKSELDKKVTRNRSNPSEMSYAKIKMNKDASCPFLSTERLCNIQLKLGEDHLSTTCASYPRTANEVNGVLERSATVSCPEVARLALLDPKGIEFDEIEESVDSRLYVSSSLDTHDLKNAGHSRRYFWELRIFTIQVLQYRTYSLADRLIILGLFYQKAEEYVTDGKVGKLPELIALYTAMLEDGTFKEGLGDIPAQSNVQLELIKAMVDKKYREGISNQRFLDCYIETLSGLKYEEGSSFEELAKEYPSTYETYYKPFMDEKEYIMENYLVNYVYKNLFPFSGFPTMFDCYVMLVVSYAILKLHLIGMAGFHKGLDEEKVVKLFQSFSKTVEHNKFFLKNLFDLLHKHGFTSMAYMAILIKN